MQQVVSVDIDDKIGWITIDNPPVNATSTNVRVGLASAIESVQGLDLAVLTCAGKTFVAGGDMTEFDKPPVEPHLPDVVNAIEQSKTPVLCILHGNVLGGGFEIAMACAFRIAKPGTRFGLPEVNVGLIPGAGGTQRAPRLLGWRSAVDVACYGKFLSAEELLSIGAIDEITDTPKASAAAYRNKTFERTSEKHIDPPSQKTLEEVEEWIKKHAKGRRAPLYNFEALQWSLEPFEQGQPKERALHLELRQTDESKALRHVFFAERSVARPAILKGTDPSAISNVSIVGGGLMGTGIAAACLNGGYQVTIIERDTDAATSARDNVAKLLDTGLRRGKMTQEQFNTRMSVFRSDAGYELAAEADLAIEAVFEDLDAKRDVFSRLNGVMKPDALLATNTSYLDPNDIFSQTDHPERCLGLHFFSPAHIMKLVEVIRSARTTPEVLATAFKFVSSLRKTPVLTGICDGFIGNRILMAYRRAAEYLLADGALPHEVDAAMRAFGMAMGPFETQDMSGLQIAEATRRRQDATRDPAERYVPISDRLCQAGRYGKRSGAGWYRYEDATGKPEIDEVVNALICDYSTEQGISRHRFEQTELQAQLLAAMINEGARIVEEGIAASDDDVDVVKVSGYGFPRWRGGPMHWGSQQGAETIQRSIKQLKNASPESWRIAERFAVREH